MYGAILVYLGLGVALLGAISVIKPLHIFLIRSRLRALCVLLLGFIIICIGWMLPAPETRVSEFRTRLDEFMPVYQFHELHSTDVPGQCDKAYGAIQSVTADEILFCKTLVRIRRFGRSTSANILNPPPDEPIIHLATRTSFLKLAEQPGRELVLGTLVLAPHGWRPPAHATREDFKALHAPGFAVAAMNFLLVDEGVHACRVSTETRVYATDPTSCRRFAAYWRVMYPGSALIRRMWLRAIRKRTLIDQGSTTARLP